MTVGGNAPEKTWLPCAPNKKNENRRTVEQKISRASNP